MKRVLYIAVVVSVVVLVALGSVVGGCSCGNAAGGENNDNNDSSSDGGDDGIGGGGGNGDDILDPTPTTPSVVINNVNDKVVEVEVLERGNGTNIKLKASGFPESPAISDVANTDSANIVMGAPAGSFVRAFDFTIAGGVVGNSPATAGLVLVNTGNTASDAFLLDAVKKNINTYSPSRRVEGLHNVWTGTNDNPNRFILRGHNVYSTFMSREAPSDSAFAPNFSPFAFTEVEVDGFKVKPIFFCRTLITSITSAGDTGGGTAQDGTKLTGGQKASCYVASSGKAFTGKMADIWLKTKASPTFKKTFNVAVMGIRTDDKTIAQIGLPGENKAAAFRDGISPTEMTALAAANPSDYKTFSVSIKKDDKFTYTPPPAEITIENIDDSIAELDGNTIKLKASVFPTIAISTDIAGASFASLKSAPTGSLKKVFDVVITSDASTVTGGLVLVNTGDKVANQFLLDGVNKQLATYSDVEQKEGLRSSKATNVASSDGIFPAGWNIFSVFMNNNAPASAYTLDKPPFAFTEIEVNGLKAKPILLCRTTVDSITSAEDTGDGTAQDSTKLTGGKKASCYVGSLGNPFTGRMADNWLSKIVNILTPFKKNFDIAVLAIRTDGKTISQIGLPGEDSTATFRDGISEEEMVALTNANSSDYKKFTVSIIRDDDFSYTLPSSEIKIKISDANVAKLKRRLDGSEYIIINADKFPAVDPSFLGENDTASDVDTASSGDGAVKEAFELSIVAPWQSTGGTELIDPRRGLVFVDVGSKTKFSEFTTTASGVTVNYGSGPYTSLTSIDNRNAPNYDFLSYGMRFFGVFGDKTAATDVNDPNTAPFSFTWRKPPGEAGVQPLLVCRSVVKNITEPTPLLDTVLYGGQSSKCYIGSRGTSFVNVEGGTQHVDNWFNDATTKRSFYITVAGVNTGSARISDVFSGLDGTTSADRVGDFIDGLDANDMAAIERNNKTTYRKILVKLVRQTEFDAIGTTK